MWTHFKQHTLTTHTHKLADQFIPVWVKSLIAFLQIRSSCPGKKNTSASIVLAAVGSKLRSCPLRNSQQQFIIRLDGQHPGKVIFTKKIELEVPSKLLKRLVWVQREYCSTSSITSITLCTLYWQRQSSWASCVIQWSSKPGTVEALRVGFYFWLSEKATEEKRTHSVWKLNREKLFCDQTSNITNV